MINCASSMLRYKVYIDNDICILSTAQTYLKIPTA